MTEAQLLFVQEKSRTLRHHIVDMIGYGEGRVGHLGGSSSAAEIVATLYFYKMRYDAQNPGDRNRDRFVLSKGHAALVQYAALAEAGFFPVEELLRVKNYNAMLQGHPDMRKTPGIEANTGSLGMGLSIGLGMALGLRLDGLSSNVFVLMGDGEQDEGQIWEAAMCAAYYRAGNLIAVIDHNKIQATGFLKDRLGVGSLYQKWSAFGWEVMTADGHNVREIAACLDSADSLKDRPVVIIADTVKGKYITFAENTAAFHNAGLTEEQFKRAHNDISAYGSIPGCKSCQT